MRKKDKLILLKGICLLSLFFMYQRGLTQTVKGEDSSSMKLDHNIINENDFSNDKCLFVEVNILEKK